MRACVQEGAKCIEIAFFDPADFGRIVRSIAGQIGRLGHGERG